MIFQYLGPYLLNTFKVTVKFHTYLAETLCSPFIHKYSSKYTQVHRLFFMAFKFKVKVHF